MFLLNEAKPKYEYLDIILEKQLSDIRFSQQVNIIVDLKEVLKKFFRPDFEPTKDTPQNQLVEEVSSDSLL